MQQEEVWLQSCQEQPERGTREPVSVAGLATTPTLHTCPLSALVCSKELIHSPSTVKY